MKKSQGERVRTILHQYGLLNGKYLIQEQDGSLLLPLKSPISDRAAQELENYTYEIVPLPEPKIRLPVSDPYDVIYSRCELPLEKKRLLMRKWELIGNVLILRIPEELRFARQKLAKLYAEVLGADTVLEELSGISGEMRRPNMEILYGNNTETVHHENGIKYKLDTKELMFSSGNISERLRVSEFNCRNEIVVDMFAGIGYFTLPIAVYAKPRRIYACEINEISFNYLKENVALNNVDTIVEPALGDCRNTAPEKSADRIMMGLIKSTPDFIQKALAVLKETGGIIHYHDTVPEEDIPDAPFSLLEKAGNHVGFDAKLQNYVKIKSYAPGIVHVVLDVEFK